MKIAFRVEYFMVMNSYCWDGEISSDMIKLISYSGAWYKNSKYGTTYYINVNKFGFNSIYYLDDKNSDMYKYLKTAIKMNRDNILNQLLISI